MLTKVAMASLADELLADVDAGAGANAHDNAGASTSPWPEVATDQTLGASSHADELMLDVEAHDVPATHDSNDTEAPPDEMDQAELDAVDVRVGSVDSARHISKLYGSDTLRDLLTVRCMHCIR